jgi:hypothetical protein
MYALILIPLAALAGERPSLRELREDHACNAAITATLKEWVAKPDWKETAPPEAESRAFRTQGSELGTSIDLVIYEDGTAEAIRKTSDTTLVAMWSAPDCTPKIAAEARKPSQDAFTDAELKKVLGAHAKGVVYFWSPHMHLSLKALPELRKAASKLGLTVVTALDPWADPAFARKTASANGLGQSDLRRVESVEMLSRGVNIHYPSAVAFAGGKLSPALITGYKEASEFETLLKRDLASIK